MLRFEVAQLALGGILAFEWRSIFDPNRHADVATADGGHAT
jgi:hypothetical protein